MMDITVCIITRDQESELRQCLLALKKLPWKILVVDTGSLDGSLDVARELADAVYEFEWIDDFAAARNFAASKADTGYILAIDTDEFLEESDMGEVLNLMESRDGVGCIRLRNRFRQKGEERNSLEWLPRLYEKEKYHFMGSVHEQIVPKSGGKSKRFRIPLNFLHTGYDLSGDARERKANRNISLLEKELSNKLSQTEGQDAGNLSLEEQNEIAYLYFQLGKSYYFLQDYEKSADYFDLGLAYDLDERLDYVRDMIDTYGYALINSGQIDRAAGLLNIYDTFSDRADFVFMIGLLKMQMTLFDEAVTEFIKATDFKESNIEGANSFLAYYNAGVIRQVQGRLEEAKDYYDKCGDYEPAKQRLKEMA